MRNAKYPCRWHVRKCYFLWRYGPTWAMTSPFLRFTDHTQQRTMVGMTPLDEWSVCCWDLYLTTHNTHKKQTFMPPLGFKPMIPGSQRPQNHALDRAATEIGCKDKWVSKLWTSVHKDGHESTQKPYHTLRVFFPREHNTGMNTLRLLRTLYLTSWLKRT